MYNRENAVNYAHRWAFSRNPRFYDFQNIGGDCTNFASQVVFAGCGQMNYTPTFGWYYNNINDRSPSWTGVNQFYNFLINNQGPGPRAVLSTLSQVEPGDIIQLDFNASTPAFDHSPVVVDAGRGTPDTILLAAHTNDSDYRPLSTYNYENYRVLKIFCD